MITEHLKNFFKLVRWFHELLAILPFVGLYFVIRYYADLSGLVCDLSGFDFFLLCLCVQLLIAAGCVLNDIMDRRIDEVNKPHTHLVGRVISLKASWLLFVSISLLILLLTLYISRYMFGEWLYIATLVYFFSILYDVYFKKSPLFGNILIAALASFIPLVLFFFAKSCINSLQNEKINTLIYLYSFFPFMIIIPRELSLDISDMEGDRAGGCRTLPLVIGVEKSKRLVGVFILAIILFSFFVSFKYRYLAPVFGVVNVLLLYYLYRLKKSVLRIEYIKAGRFLWFVMILGLIGFTLSTIYS